MVWLLNISKQKNYWGSTCVNASINLDFHIYPMESNPDVLLRLSEWIPSSFIKSSSIVHWCVNECDRGYRYHSSISISDLLSIGEVEPYLEDRKLKGKIDSISINATEVFSSIGDVSQTWVGKGIQNCCHRNSWIMMSWDISQMQIQCNEKCLIVIHCRFLTGFDAIFKTVSTSLLSVLLSKGIPLPIFDNLSISGTFPSLFQ